MLGTDAWSMSHSCHRPSEPAYYIEDCRIYDAVDAIYRPKIENTYCTCKITLRRKLSHLFPQRTTFYFCTFDAL